MEKFDALEPEALMIRLQNTFRVELRVLEGCRTGCNPGHLWRALEIAQERNMDVEPLAAISILLARVANGKKYSLVSTPEACYTRL
ncbi:hypothetical protein SDC9_16426 [bioreactor metagenome]|uniref:Uncharacterized protein n=1 Tax=bioreactor metagenome TaxID=1076179 RepID=A0A644TW60_9ZZZZ|nr:hypothetical protein [Treponema sp.]HAP55709.1 hypothetical protein [Spirochaetaceae bacterium]HOI23765.1 hypothetical protein [Spirochaetales bacterium]